MPRISYARSADGVSLARTVAGDGPALVFVPWVPFSNLRVDWENPFLGGIFELHRRCMAQILIDVARSLAEDLPRGRLVSLEGAQSVLFTEDAEAVVGTPLELSHAVLEGMLSRRRGHIVNISAMAGRLSFPCTEVYAAAKDGIIGFTRVFRSDYHPRGVSASVLILGAIKGAGQGQRTLDQAGMKAPAYMARAESVARAVVKAVQKDKAELVIMPGPARLMRAVMDYFPGLGPAMNRAAGAKATMQTIIELRAAQADVRR